MTDSDQSPSADRLTDYLHEGAHDDALACLDRLATADTAARKRGLRAVRTVAEDGPVGVEGLADALVPFLTADERAVALTAAKLFVTLAESEPETARPAVDSLAERLADDAEFYYVRARCAEALGYVALESPDAVSDPEILADLRVGLSFDEPEVKEKLAKALAYVALGDPSRLRHHVSSLAAHLDDDEVLVRYQLCTALVAIGCESPGQLAEAVAGLRERVDDTNPYVGGRAAEGLALAVRSGVDVEPTPDIDAAEPASADSPPFLTERVGFLHEVLAADGESVAVPDGLGTVESVRDGTADVVEAITEPDGTECPHCGFGLPEDSSPICPRCGTPCG
ncbi:HEAT repeat domain-containing protein [Haloplanus sp. C73]|uniref:HEAT repeat domain-containing protein n=1 Tax=Haloplanus sp. C73 TaxID=3421641 RepID=UPI003EBDCC4B